MCVNVVYSIYMLTRTHVGLNSVRLKSPQKLLQASSRLQFFFLQTFDSHRGFNFEINPPSRDSRRGSQFSLHLLSMREPSRYSIFILHLFTRASPNLTNILRRIVKHFWYPSNDSANQRAYLVFGRISFPYRSKYLTHELSYVWSLWKSVQVSCRLVNR